jgi:hypothetical protein
MTIPAPANVPRKDPDLGHPVVPPDDPNVDRLHRGPDIDPPPTDPPLEAPSEEPGAVDPPTRACGRGVRARMSVGSFLPTCRLGFDAGASAP